MLYNWFQKVGEYILDIGKIINERRTLLGLTLEELGNAVGVSKSTVKKWEDGFISNMKRDKIAKLASTLKINPVALITGNEEDLYIVSDSKEIKLTNHENKVITAYRDKPAMQPAVDKILGVEDEQSEIPTFRHPGELTKYKRQKLGLTQEELAQKLGISVSEIKQWEAYGSYINYNKVSLLANILGIEALDLLPKNDGFFDSVKAADSKSFGNAFGSKNNK